jgi:hypothetical protein
VAVGVAAKVRLGVGTDVGVAAAGAGVCVATVGDGVGVATAGEGVDVAGAREGDTVAPEAQPTASIVTASATRIRVAREFEFIVHTSDLGRSNRMVDRVMAPAGVRSLCRGAQNSPRRTTPCLAVRRGWLGWHARASATAASMGGEEVETVPVGDQGVGVVRDLPC